MGGFHHYARSLSIYDNIILPAYQSKKGKGKEYDLLLLLVESPCKTLHKDFLFDSFYRGSNVTDKPGNGLGLYISRQIMNKMDGEIFAERKENGMSFCMVFRL